MKRTHHANSDDGTVDAKIFALFVSFALQFGMDLQEIEENAGVGGIELMRPDARIPDASVAKLWRALSAKHPGVLLSVELGRSAPYSIMGDIAHGARFANDLGAALGLLTSNAALIADRLYARLEDRKSKLRV